MHTEIINTTTRPELFYMSDPATGQPTREILRSVGQDEAGPYICMQRRSATGVQELRMYAHTTALYDDNVLVAEQWVKMEVSEDGGETWRTPETVEKLIDTNDNGEIDAVVSVGAGAYLYVKSTWIRTDGKQTFEVNAPGKLVRVVWIIKPYRRELFNFNHDDYSGGADVVDSGGVITVTFEPGGVADHLVVDPYLGVDEQATYIDVTLGAGYKYRLYTNATHNDVIYDGAVAIFYNYWGWLYKSSTIYRVRSDPSYSYVVEIDSPTKVVIYEQGHPHSGAAYLDATNFNYVERRTTFYPDGRVFFQINHNAINNTTIDDNAGSYLMSLQEQTADTWQQFWGTSTAETDGNNSITGADDHYVGLRTTGDAASAHIIVVPGGYVTDAQSLNANLVRVYVSDTQIDAGDNIFISMIRLDYGGSLSAADRYGYQADIRDNTLSWTTGTAVTGLTNPQSIGSSGYASDGIWHVNAATGLAAELTWDRNRYAPSIVIENWTAATVPQLKINGTLKSRRDPSVGTGDYDAVLLMPFNSMSVTPTADETVTDATTGGTATLKTWTITSGTVGGGDAAGWFYLEPGSGAFGTANNLNGSTSGSNFATENGYLRAVVSQAGDMTSSDTWLIDDSFASGTGNPWYYYAQQ